MAKYTTELRSICETYAGYDEQQGLGNTSAVIQAALPKIFDFDFPIYDESYRNVLETKIVRHFYTREICAETVGRWKLFLEDRLNLIMPYYNKLYQSELVEFNPMYDVDLTTDHTKDNGGNAESQSNRTDSSENNRKYSRSDGYSRDLTETQDYTRNLADSSENEGTSTTHATDVDSQTSRQRYSDTPQGALTGIEANNYLTNATLTDADDTDTTDSTTTTSEKNSGKQTGTSTTSTFQTGTANHLISDTDDTTRSETGNQNGTSKYTDTESYLEHVKGKTAGTSYSRLLNEYRQTFLNIDRQVIGQLEDLFINLW